MQQSVLRVLNLLHCQLRVFKKYTIAPRTQQNRNYFKLSLLNFTLDVIYFDEYI